MISHSVETPRGTGAFFLIPSVFFVSSPPDKVGYFPRAFDFFLNPSVFLTPSPYGHSPYILLRKTPRNATGHGRGGG